MTATLTHDNDGTLLVQNDAIALHALCATLNDSSQSRIKGVCEAYMTNYTALKEGEGPNAFGAIDDLIRDNEVHWLDFLLQRAHGREGDDAPHTQMPQGSNVGSVGDFVRRILVVQTVSGKKGNVGAIVGEDLDRRGGRAPRSDGVDGSNGFIALEMSESRAANDGDVDGFWGEVSCVEHKQ